MKIIIGFFIFCLVLFLYLHIQFHNKTSDDLEMYDIDNVSKDRFDEICDIRQPVLFDFDESEKICNTTNKTYLETNYPAFEIKIRNINDTSENSELYMPLQLQSASTLFNQDKSSSYFSESNQDFLQETSVIKSMQYNDEFLRPCMVSNCNYDIMMGSNGVITPFRYELNYRNYFVVTQGSIKVKMAPPKSIKYLSPHNDYENFEFKSPVNPWTPQPQYSADFDKMKCLEFSLTRGKALYIPAYWWYSIKFEGNCSITCFRYRTYMNNIAIVPHIFMYALQIQNVKRDVVKKAPLSELSLKPPENIQDNMTTTVLDKNIIPLTEQSTSIQTDTKISDLPVSNTS